MLPGGFGADRLDGQSVELVDLGGEEAADARAQSLGRSGDFLFDAVPAGRYRIAARVAGFEADPIHIELGIGETLRLGDVEVRTSAADTFGRVGGTVLRQGAAEGLHGDVKIQAAGTPYFTLSDADGVFLLDLPAGEHTLHFTTPDFAAEERTNVRVNSGDTTTISPDVVLAARPGSIAGQLLLLEALEDPGARLSSGSVRLLAVDAPDESPPALATVPGRDGRFVLAPVLPGRWRVRAEVEGFTPVDLEVEVRAGTETRLDGLSLLPAALDASVTGRVILEGAPPDAWGGTRVRVVGTPYEAETESDGTFVLPLPGGTHDLRFEHGGYEPQALAAVRLEPGEAHALDAPVTLFGRPGRITGLVRLPAGLDSPDRIVRTDVRRFVDGEDEAADRVNPGADGSFVFDAVPIGDWRVEASLAGYPVAVGYAAVGPGEVARVGVLALRDPTEAGGSPTQVVGTAHLADVFEPDGHGGILVETLTTAFATVTTGEGRFTVPAPPGEPVRLRLSRLGYDPAEVQVDPIPAGESRDVAEVALLHAQPGSLRGSVEMDRFELDPGSVSLSIGRPGGDLLERVSPDPAGAFRFADVTAGDLVLIASRRGFLGIERPVTVRRGDETDVGELLLRHLSQTPTAVTLAGTVDIGGRPDGGGTRVRVELAGADSGVLGTTVTDGTGRFSLPAAPDEEYVISTERPGFDAVQAAERYHYDPADDRFEDAADRPVEIELRPAPFDGQVRVGIVLRPDWIPADQRTATVTLQSESFQASRAVVRAGEPALIGEVPAGTHVLRVERPGFTSFTTLVTLSPATPVATFDPVVLDLRDLGAADFDLGGVTLRGEDLPDDVSAERADLSGATLTGDFTGARLSGAILADATLRDAIFADADLSEARLSGADLSGADLTRADLSLATLFGADLSGASLVGADLSLANLSSARLVGARFNEARAPLPGPPCDDVGRTAAVILVGATVAGADLSGAMMDGVDLRDLDLGGARLVGTTLRQACLRGANLTLADLTGADLRRADAESAILVNTILAETDLRGADLAAAQLINAVLISTESV